MSHEEYSRSRRRRHIRKFFQREAQLLIGVLVGGIIIGGLVYLFDPESGPVAGLAISLLAYPIVLILRIILWTGKKIF